VPDALQELLHPIAVLHTGGRDDHRGHQAEGIHEEVTLASFDLLAGIVALDPPFSVVLTD
jgi:hypothetical protein